MKPVKTALIGSGAISYIYLDTLKNGGFTIIDLVGCSDLIPERSKARAETFGIRQMTNDEILNDPDIEIVLNTTQLWNHSEVNRVILEAGKHVYAEKAVGATYEGAKASYDLARSKNLLLGCAPDCYMGAAFQTGRKLIDDGMIGQPLFAHAFCYRDYQSYARPGDLSVPEAGAAGSTIPYDMSAYYINVLVNLLGPVNRVSGYTRFFKDRVNLNPRHPQYKQPIEKLTGATLMMGCLEFENGCYASLTMCSEGYGPEIPRMEIYGTDGVLTLPDPNCFGGRNGLDVYLARAGNPEPLKMPFTHGFADKDPYIKTLSGKPEPCHNSWRGIAVVDMAWALRRNRPHRSSAELALHTVEIVHAIDQCTLDNKTRIMESRPQRPAPLRPGLFGASAEASIDTD